MFGSDILEVAVGLALLFLIVSLICTAAREGLEAIMRTRAMDLERGIRELLDDPDGSSLTKTLFDHPMIYALFGGKYDPDNLTQTVTLTGEGERFHMRFLKRRNLPSYIPAGHFAAAIIDIIARGPSTPPPYPVPDAQPPVPPGTALSVEALRSAAASFPNEKIKRAMLSAIDFAEGDLANVKVNLENWFDGTMDRASGWYKRRTQVILFFMGLFAAAALNIDAIEIAKRLYRDDPLREAVVAQAERVVEAGKDAAGNPLFLQGKDLPELREELDSIGYPIGWWNWWPDPQSRPDDCIKPVDPVECKRTLPPATKLQIGLGWFITALAAMLGAPFWFDLLNKFMVIRSTVKPHEKSPEEGSEDRQPAVQPAAAPPTQAGALPRPPPPQPSATPAPPPAPAFPFEPHTWKNGSQDGDV